MMNEESTAALYIVGRRAVAEALRSGRDIEKIFVEFGVQEGGIRDILKAARQERIPIVTADKKKFRQMEVEANAQNTSQGVLALSVAYNSVDIIDLLSGAFSSKELPLIVALDGINDPHNLGAIARSAVCAGASGMILPIRDTAPVGSAAIKTSAGAFEYLPISKVNNLNTAFEKAKELGYWIIGTDADSTHPYTAGLYDRPVILVIGSEGNGLRSSTRKACDAIVSIPLDSAISSLNASVAAGIVMFEMHRQRSLAAAAASK